MKTLSLILVLIVALAPWSAPGQSQQEMNQQARKGFEKADKELNGVYQKVIKQLPDEEAVALLRKAQRAWVAYRDADAASYSDEMRGGSASPLLLYGHMTQLTRERIKFLRHRIKMRE